MATLADWTVEELQEAERDAAWERGHIATLLKSCPDHKRPGLELAWAEADRDVREYRAAIFKATGGAA